jgi:putative SOS response-associated peptidase YedK
MQVRPVRAVQAAGDLLSYFDAVEAEGRMHADWLNPGATDEADVQHLLDAIPEPVLTPRVVSGPVTSVRNNGPELLEPADKEG